MIIEIRARDFPGRRCGPEPGGGWYENVQVGPRRGKEAVELLPGDAPSGRWELDVSVRSTDGEHDFGGPFVYGKRGERSVSLRWLSEEEDGSLSVFRAAKLRLSDVEAGLLDEAIASGRLVADLGLTDSDGWPRCASVRPPDVTWSAG
jgi:hypothetical protein